jgi:hypothetical protein
MHPLVMELKSPQELPVAAMQACLAEIDTVAPELLAAVERFAAGNLDREDYDLVFLGLHVLAAAREPRLWPLLPRVIRRPDDELHDVLGESRPDNLGKIIVNVWDGDVDALWDMVCDRSIYDGDRLIVWCVLAFLTWEGRIAPEVTRGLLARHDLERPVAEGDLGWVGWGQCVELLGWQELVPMVERAYQDGRMPWDFTRIDDLTLGLAQTAAAAVDDASRFRDGGVGYLGDLSTELADYLFGAERDAPPPPRDPGIERVRASNGYRRACRHRSRASPNGRLRRRDRRTGMSDAMIRAPAAAARNTRSAAWRPDGATRLTPPPASPPAPAWPGSPARRSP